jgi:hypothetical protein
MQHKARKLAHRLLSAACDGHKEKTACADFELSLDKPRNGPGIALHLWVYFSTTLVETKVGDIALRVKRCRLCLDLSNATIPLRDRGLKAVMPLNTVTTIEKLRSHTDSAGNDGDAKISVKVSTKGPMLSGDLGSKQSSTTKDEDVLKRQYSFVASQVQAGGTETRPCWDFCDETGAGFLLGGIDNQFLGKLTLSGNPCKIRGSIEAYDKDLVLEGRSGIFTKILNKSDRVVRRKLALLLLKGYVHPYLCERCYEVNNDP